MFVALFGKKIYLTLKLTFDLELWQNKSRNQKRPLLKIFHLVQVSFVPSGIILLQNAVGMSLTCPLIGKPQLNGVFPTGLTFLNTKGQHLYTQPIDMFYIFAGHRDQIYDDIYLFNTILNFWTC